MNKMKVALKILAGVVGAVLLASGAVALVGVRASDHPTEGDKRSNRVARTVNETTDRDSYAFHKYWNDEPGWRHALCEEQVFGMIDDADAADLEHTLDAWLWRALLPRRRRASKRSQRRARSNRVARSVNEIPTLRADGTRLVQALTAVVLTAARFGSWEGMRMGGSAA